MSRSSRWMRTVLSGRRRFGKRSQTIRSWSRTIEEAEAERIAYENELDEIRAQQAAEAQAQQEQENNEESDDPNEDEEAETNENE